MAGMAEYGCKWLEIARNGLQWYGFITVFGTWGVWDMKLGDWGSGKNEY